MDAVGASMEKKVGTSVVDLDARFESIRTSETNIGNLVTDIMREGTKSDVAILNSGTLRADCIMPAGTIYMRDLVALLPMVDELCVIQMTGTQLLSALENGVSQYPRLEGRFPQLSGVSFKFDPDKDAGRRVVEGSVKVGGEAMELDRKYSVCIKAYLYLGKDGYDMFPDCPMLMDSEIAPVLPALVRNHFSTLAVMNGFKKPESPAGKFSIHTAIAKFKKSAYKEKVAMEDHASPTKEQLSLAYAIAPKLEDRIVNITKAVTITIS